MHKSIKKIIELESLRGIASIIVFTKHFFNLFVSWSLISKIQWCYFVINGRASVYLFFILSGYVLSYGLVNAINGRKLVATIAKRFLRLSFLVWMCGLIALVLSYFELLHDPFDYTHRHFEQINISPTTLIGQNIFVFINGIHIDQVFWTMKYEFLCSVFLFACIFIAHYFKKTILFFLFVFSMLIVFVLLFPILPSSFHAIIQRGGGIIIYSTFFISGCILSLLPRKKLTNYWAIPYITIFYLFFQQDIFFVVPTTFEQSTENTVNILILCCLGCIIVYCSSLIPIISKLLSAKLLIFFGSISFALYGIHSLVFGSLIFYIKEQMEIPIAYLYLASLFSCASISYILFRLDSVWVKFLNKINIKLLYNKKNILK